MCCTRKTGSLSNLGACRSWQESTARHGNGSIFSWIFVKYSRYFPQIRLKMASISLPLATIRQIRQAPGVAFHICNDSSPSHFDNPSDSLSLWERVGVRVPRVRAARWERPAKEGRAGLFGAPSPGLRPPSPGGRGELFIADHFLRERGEDMEQGQHIYGTRLWRRFSARNAAAPCRRRKVLRTRPTGYLAWCPPHGRFETRPYKRSPVSRAPSRVSRRVERTFLMAMANARVCPMMTTSRLPRVTAV